MSIARARGRKAWLITWEWVGQHASVPEDEVLAAVLKPNLGGEYIRRLTEILYAAREYAEIDKLSALIRNPYPATFGTTSINTSIGIQNIPYVDEVFCGHNPYLHARRVAGLRLRDPADQNSGLIWEEIPKPKGLGLKEEDPDWAPLEPPEPLQNPSPAALTTGSAAST